MYKLVAFNEWENLSGEENPEQLEQVIRLPEQQYDEESGLYITGTVITIRNREYISRRILSD
ncbi:hypothetical protein A628_02447 [Salmonella enterica subsp. enterica serovar Cubana str. 76814]|uniref:Uncharacterized protein n=1 Tax=Salmonella enterica subsp. enterica serovar Cubana str. 76814 TaxID=1192560 RepID=V7IRJ8_SALET|nr:hypothetical protein A628_02447 [Salmonella enterica subsp. enterica serovar Cubana str. 76814]